MPLNHCKRAWRSECYYLLRREMGRDIDGACGQLRRRYHEEEAGT